MKRSPLPRSSKPIARRKPVKRVNAKRKAKAFTFSYGSMERVQFVRQQPCANCGVVGQTENAHGHHEKRGKGQKASALSIIPLCGPWQTGTYRYVGCHAKYDRHELPWLTHEKTAVMASNLEAAFQKHQQENPI